jgi:5-methylthioadenosine/S-adenosylhomocysteine deaminase
VETQAPEFPVGTPVVFRSATVVTVDPSLPTQRDCDVLVIDGTIAAVGPKLDVPEGTLEIFADNGILMPGMIDTHRHMYQTGLRGLGADWSLTNYFYFFYVNHGQHFRPEDVYAGNLLAAVESIDAGVTTTVDWSHGLRTPEHAAAALDALERVPARFMFAYGNLAGSPSDWTVDPGFREFVSRRMSNSNPLMNYALAFDVTGDPSFPERVGFETARELNLPVTTHSGAWGATSDASISLIAEHGFLTDRLTHVHASTLSDESYYRIAASGACVSLATESEDSAGQGYPPSHNLRRFGIPISLSVDTSVWWSADMFSAMRATLNADRAREHMDAHKNDETIANLSLRAADVVEWATLGGARAIYSADFLGSITPGKAADLVLIKNDSSPVMTPILNPEGHIVFQAGRGDVHTVMVAGRVLKYAGRLLCDDLLNEAKRLVGESLAHLEAAIGSEAWYEAMNPQKPDVTLLANPYQYSDFSQNAEWVRDEITQVHDA